MYSLEIKELENGNLELSISGDLQEFIDETSHVEDESGIYSELLADYSCNGMYWQCEAEHIGALTSDPYLLTDDLEIEDDGTVNVRGDVWYYNDYMIKSLVNELKEGRSVIMHKASDIKKEPEIETIRGWWSLKIDLHGAEVSESSLEYIAEQIKQGFTSGEVIETIEGE